MIPRAHITAWRAAAPWPADAQVEQDLVLSRAIVELFRSPTVAQTLLFRGGTALHKLFFERPGRYSEDIDLVQLHAGAIGPVLGAIRAVLDPWLGEPKRKQGHGRVTVLYRFVTTSLPVQQMRLKLEINTREHFAVLGAQHRTFVVDSPWFSGSAEVSAFQIEEILGTKLRALYQRKKGRDLYDLWLALTSLAVDDEKIVACFNRYLSHDQTSISRADFEANMSAKLQAPAFREDIVPLLPSGAQYPIVEAAALIQERLVAKLLGEPWKGSAP